MINEQIMTYVAGERTRGVADDAIRGALLSQGWKEEDVAGAMGFGATLVATGPREFSFGNLFEGRLMRWQYFITGLLFGLVFIPIGFIAGLGAYFVTEAVMYVMYALYILAVPLSISLSVRRAHDLNWSGWYVLFLFIPIVGFIFALLFLFKKGTDGPNQYGPPQADRSFKNALLNL